MRWLILDTLHRPTSNSKSGYPVLQFMTTAVLSHKTENISPKEQDEKTTMGFVM